MYVISMYRVAAVFESFAQSKGMTSQRISASPNLPAVWGRRATGGGGDRIVGSGELAGDVVGSDGRHVGVFPGMTADLHTGVGDALRSRRVGCHLVADQEESGL